MPQGTLGPGCRVCSVSQSGWPALGLREGCHPALWGRPSLCFWGRRVLVSVAVVTSEDDAASEALVPDRGQCLLCDPGRPLHLSSHFPHSYTEEEQLSCLR